MPRVEFEADTEEELLALAWRWVMGPARDAGRPVTDQADQLDLRRRQLGEVLNAVRGADSRRLLREVAELSARDEALVLNAELAARTGSRPGPRSPESSRARTRSCAGSLAETCSSWDADARGYRMDPADAEIVLQRWPAA